LNESQLGQIVIGIEKLLTNGKGRIIIEFNKESAQGTGGAEILEKTLRKQKSLAQKMKGDILYVVPGSTGERILGSFGSVESAKQTILGKHADLSKDKMELVEDLRKSKLELKKLSDEHLFLEKKVEELLNLARKPSSDQTLKEAVEHYRKLAAEAEAQPQKSEKQK
jgi:hypothetical protein